MSDADDPAVGDGKIDALLALRSDGRLLVGRERIRLLEAVAEHGNISKAARAVGFSYKTAWDAVNAINNLLPRPAFITRAGGRQGGGAEVTDEGRRLIRAFHRLEAQLARISAAIAEEGLEAEDVPLFSLGLRISTRNVFRCEVMAVARGRVDVDVALKVSEEATLRATVTNEAADELALEPGRRVLALVKSPFVRLLLAAGNGAGDNSFPGRVIRRLDSDPKSEIVLDIGSGKTMTAVVPLVDIQALALKEGDRAVAAFDASHVILAAD